MALDNRMVVDVRGISTTTTVAVNSTLATILTLIGTKILAQDGAGNNQRVQKAMSTLNALADQLRVLHM